ncbi:unnamed protein product, partial [Ectocarpus sp. 4 AP-2014]
MIGVQDKGRLDHTLAAMPEPTEARSPATTIPLATVGTEAPSLLPTLAMPPTPKIPPVDSRSLLTQTPAPTPAPTTTAPTRTPTTTAAPTPAPLPTPRPNLTPPPDVQGTPAPTSAPIAATTSAPLPTPRPNLTLPPDVQG